MTRAVVHFLDSTLYGGCEAVVSQLLAGLSGTAWRPVLFHHDEPGISRLLDDARRFDVPTCAVLGVTNRNAVRTLWPLVRELRRAGPALVHLHLNWPLSGRYVTAAARLGGIPGVVATAHTTPTVSDVPLGQLRHRLRTMALDRYIAVSGQVETQLCNDLGVPRSKVRVVRNGVPLATFDTAPDAALRRSLGGHGRAPIVLTVARLNTDKGHVHLLEAAALVPDARFVFVGEGPERETLEALARRLGIADRVAFLGNRDDVPQLLASCDLFVLPSLYEGLPISILEAMAAGKPVVATAIGGTSEEVVEGVTGFLVPPADAGALAAGIRRVLCDEALALRLGAAGRVRAAAEFSSASMVRGVVSVYDEVIGTSAPLARHQ